MVFQYDAVVPRVSSIQDDQMPSIGDVVLVQGDPSMGSVEGRVLTVHVGEVKELGACTITLDIYVQDGSNGCRGLQAWLLRDGEVGVMIMSHDRLDEIDRDDRQVDA